MISLVKRGEPLAVAGVLARGEAARTLARLLVARPDAARRLSGVAIVDAIVVVGEASAIPWIDGATWLGREPGAAGLLVPTGRAVAPHPALVLDALRAKDRAPGAAFVLAEHGARLVAVSLASARAPGGDVLARWAS